MGNRYYLAFVIHFCFCVLTITSTPSPCTTPNGEKAQCISLFSCAILQDAIALKDDSINKFIQASNCDSGNEKFMVCCGRFANFTDLEPQLGNKNKDETTEKEAHRELVIKKLLPNKQYCGLQHTDDYFYNETVTSVDEFPWVLYIPLLQNDRFPTPGVEVKCSGVLLNNRYALTSSPCAAHILTTVKIGQYHKHKNISCITTAFGEEDCTDPAFEVKVVAKLRPPNSNLLLLRLEHNILYSDYVRPICLPLQESDRPKIGETVVTSGWGEEDSEGKYVKVKKRIKHTIVNNERCQANEYPFICASTVKNSSSYVCDGDDGGAVMYKRNNNWFVGGIIITSLECFTDEPFYAERITSEILEWIFEKIYP